MSGDGRICTQVRSRCISHVKVAAVASSWAHNDKRRPGDVPAADSRQAPSHLFDHREKASPLSGYLCADGHRQSHCCGHGSGRVAPPPAAALSKGQQGGAVPPAAALRRLLHHLVMQYHHVLQEGGQCQGGGQ